MAGERLRRAVEALAIPHAGNTPPAITISVGIATWHETDDHDAATVLQEADAALYEAKEHGRNRVIGPSNRGPTSQGILAATRS